MERRDIHSAEVTLTGTEAVGITESPNCLIPEEDDEDAFEHLTNTLAGYAPAIPPKLEIVIELSEWSSTSDE